jgi:hypothetical protein
MIFVLYGLFVRFRQAHCTPIPTRRRATRTTQKEHQMNPSHSTRFGLTARSALGAIALVSSIGVAQAQAPSAQSVAVPVGKDASKEVQMVYDPAGPFVWDALGATPSIRFPWQSANVSDSTLAQKAARADGSERAGTAAPSSAAVVVEARSQGVPAAR